MESLIGYGSDDDNEEVTQTKKQSSSQADVNYEEVQMDLSEESNDSTKLDGRRQPSDHCSKNKDGNTHLKEKDQYKKPSSSSDDYNKHKYERGRYSPKHQDSRKDDKHRDRSNRNDDDRHKREDKEKDDKSRDYRKDKYRDKGRESRRKSKDSSYESRDSSNNNKDDRRSHTNSSRDRHRSRSPRRSEYRSRRSSSRDRSYSSYPKRYDRTTSKMDRLEKLGIELNTTNSGFASTSMDLYNNDKQKQEKDRFFMPGITGRFTEQIQRRKLLWQKKDNKSLDSSGEGGSGVGTGLGIGIGNSNITAITPALPQTSSKIWQHTTFAQDTDGKVATKFKRLMGIRSNENDAEKPGNDSLKKQEEMFNSMEAQYEVARTATHTMRGVGLGFGSFQR